ncbi:MFS transporter [Caldivirga sp.]|uniref:MFS transporter n=1 Tax=Caldivirga sp. TaxID=2080243 RepID=UPI003D12F342
MVIGLIVFGLFLSHSRRMPNPIISIEDFSNPNVAVPLLASFVSGFGLFLLFQALVYLFELPRPVGFGMDILSTGITLAPISIIMLIVGPAFGALSGRVGVKPILVVAPLIAALGSLILAVASLDYSLTVADVMITLVVTLIGIGGMMVTRITVLMMSASERRLATITGTNTTMRLMGNTLGPVFASSILDTYKQGVLMGMLGKLPILYMVPSRLSFYYIFMSSAVSSILTALIALKVRETMKGAGKVKVGIPVQG